MNLAVQRRSGVERLLFAVTLATFAYFYQAADQSTAARFDLIRSILERGTLWIDGYAGYNTADIVEIGGHIYSVKAPGASVTALIPWAIASHLFSILIHGNEPLFWALVTWLTIVLSTGLLIALLSVVMYRFARFLGAGPARSAALALILSFGTILFPYATEMTGEPIAAGCGFVAFYLLATFAREPRTVRALGAGLLAGWAVLNDYPALLIAAAIGVYAIVRLPRWRDVGAFSAGAGVIALVLGAYNWSAFGSPWFVSYQAYGLPGNARFPEQAVGFVGLTYPRLQILWRILFGPQRGLFFCNPVLLLIIPGLVSFYRRKRFRAEFYLLMFAIVSFILFNASFGESIVSWGGGTATGPRQMVAALPFMVLSLAFLPRGIGYLMAGLAVASAWMMLMATAVNPHFPYEYTNPIRDYVMPAFFRGDLAYNLDAYFGGGPIVGDSVAFNLGKLIGLPGALQLFPLAALWIAGAVMLWRALAPASQRAGSAATQVAVGIGVAAMFLPTTLGGLTHSLQIRAAHGLVGRYYANAHPSTSPPHIERIDPVLDFQGVAALGGLRFPSSVVWRGKIIAPRTGRYRFRIEVDDSGWLRIDGLPVIRDPGAVYRGRAEGSVFMRAGTHRIEAGERNVAGDAAFHLYWQPPGGRYEIVPAAVLIPAPPRGGGIPRRTDESGGSSGFQQRSTAGRKETRPGLRGVLLRFLGRLLTPRNLGRVSRLGQNFPQKAGFSGPTRDAVDVRGGMERHVER